MVSIETQTDNEIMLAYIFKFLTMLENVLKSENIQLDPVKEPT